MITKKMLLLIEQSIRRPPGYSIAFNSIVQHGNGVVVLFTEKDSDIQTSQLRCAGFSFHKDGSLRQRFDTIVDDSTGLQ